MSEQERTTEKMSSLSRLKKNIEKVLPNREETVVVPTGGRFYPKNSPLYGVNELRIKHITTKEEDILASEDPKKLERFINSIILNEGVDASQMSQIDSLAVMLAARIYSYGQHIEVKVTCSNPDCRHNFTHEMDLMSTLPSEPMDVHTLKRSVYDEHGLLKTKIQDFEDDFWFYWRPTTLGEESLIARRGELARKKNKPYSSYIERLSMMLMGVDGEAVSDPETKKFLLENLSAGDAERLRKSIEEVLSALHLDEEVECSQCETPLRVTVPVDANFFSINS